MSARSTGAAALAQRAVGVRGAARIGAAIGAAAAATAPQARQQLGRTFGMAALEHAFAHVVLERQRAHLQLLDVVLDAGVERRLDAGSPRCGAARWRCDRRLARCRAALRRAARLGVGAGPCVRAAARFRAPSPAPRRLRRRAGWTSRRRRRRRPGLDQRQGVARGARCESFEVHAVLPMIEPMRIEWVSGISLWPSTFRRGAARRSSRAIGARIRSGTSRQAGWPRSSCGARCRRRCGVSVSATPGSSAAPCG